MCKILQRLFRLCEINVNTDSTLGSGKQTRLASLPTSSDIFRHLPTSSDIFRHLPTHGPGYIKPLLDYKLPYQIPFLFYTEIGLGDVLTPAIRWIENLGFNCQFVSAGGWHQQLLARIESKDQAVLSDRQGSFVLGCC